MFFFSVDSYERNVIDFREKIEVVVEDTVKEGVYVIFGMTM